MTANHHTQFDARYALRDRLVALDAALNAPPVSEFAAFIDAASKTHEPDPEPHRARSVPAEPDPPAEAFLRRRRIIRHLNRVDGLNGLPPAARLLASANPPHVRRVFCTLGLIMAAKAAVVAKTSRTLAPLGRHRGRAALDANASAPDVPDPVALGWGEAIAELAIERKGARLAHAAGRRLTSAQLATLSDEARAAFERLARWDARAVRTPIRTFATCEPDVFDRLINAASAFAATAHPVWSRDT